MAQKVPDKGWACIKCGCGHNWSTRDKCRWCGAICPVVSKQKQKQLANAWWNQWYNQRREPWVQQGQGDKGTAGDKEEANEQSGDTSERVSSLVSPVANLQAQIKHLENYPCGPPPQEQQRIKELNDQLEAERRKLEQAKPASAHIQRNESRVQTLEGKIQVNNKKAEAKQTQLVKLQEEIAHIHEDGANLKKEYDEAKAQLDEQTAALQSKPDTDMGVCEATLEVQWAKLQPFLGQEYFAKVGLEISAAAEQHRQTLATRRQEQEVAAKEARDKAAASASGGDPESRRAREVDDQAEANRQKRRSRSRSNTRLHKLAAANRKYRQETEV